MARMWACKLTPREQEHMPDRDILLDHGPHPVDILNVLLDTWPWKVSGFTRAYRNSCWWNVQ